MSANALIVADDPSLDIDAIKTAFQGAAAAYAFETLHDYHELVKSSDDPEVKRKALVVYKEIAALDLAKPKDDKPDYPVFNFVIGGSSVQVTTTMPDGNNQTLEFSPTQAMAAHTYINEDVRFDD